MNATRHLCFAVFVSAVSCASVQAQQTGTDAVPAALDELPYQLKKYIRFIEEEVGVPITLVSMGPDRTETVS